MRLRRTIRWWGQSEGLPRRHCRSPADSAVCTRWRHWVSGSSSRTEHFMPGRRSSIALTRFRSVSDRLAPREIQSRICRRPRSDSSSLLRAVWSTIVLRMTSRLCHHARTSQISHGIRLRAHSDATIRTATCRHSWLPRFSPCLFATMDHPAEEEGSNQRAQSPAIPHGNTQTTAPPQGWPR